MTTQYYKGLEDGPEDEIDAAIFSGDTFHNRENIIAFLDMMAHRERGLKETEDIVTEMEKLR